ncbi:MAG: CYTH domain-containing protein [Crocinitomicaceae bacterium]|nr:CYTH domain-containing protein [Crocinitomicaceae bacterium]
MEIERKFLVNKKLFDEMDKGIGKSIKQGYFISNKQLTVRVRTKGEKGFLTIKGATKGISREEYEYEIPYSEAVELLDKFASPYLEKTRYEVIFQNKLWEIDEFHGKLAPLLLAEVELTSEDEKIAIPEWVTEEVSINPNYFNSEIVKNLY